MNAQIRKLITALEVRQAQLSASLEGGTVNYALTQMHHMRDVMTVLAVLKGEKNAAQLLENMPKKSAANTPSQIDQLGKLALG